MERISDSITIVREVLEANHPSAEVKVAESGESDFRISSVGASISVTEYNNLSVTDGDIEEIVSRSEDEVEGRYLECRKDDNDKVWFDLSS